MGRRGETEVESRYERRRGRGGEKEGKGEEKEGKGRREGRDRTPIEESREREKEEKE